MSAGEESGERAAGVSAGDGSGDEVLYETEGRVAAELIGTVFDGIARHAKEGYAFQQLAARRGFREAVRHRDEPFGDHGR